MKLPRRVGVGSWFAWDFYQYEGHGWFRAVEPSDLWFYADGYVLR